MDIFCAVGKVLCSILGHKLQKEELLCLNHCFLPFCLLQRKHEVESGLCISSLEWAYSKPKNPEGERKHPSTVNSARFT